jgi:hypothetical protein
MPKSKSRTRPVVRVSESLAKIIKAAAGAENKSEQDLMDEVAPLFTPELMRRLRSLDSGQG